MAVARGPPEAVVDAVGEFKSSLQRPVIDDGEMSALLAAPSPPFAMVEVEDLLPAEHRERCRQLADEAASAGG